jgi:hypothetical protein
MEAYKDLQPLVSRVARGNITEEAKAVLSRLSASDEERIVLVQFCRLKTGPGRSWNPNSGAITSSVASTLVQAALVSCKSGTVLWKGEQYVRNKAVKPTSKDFDKILSLLYKDLDMK